ncbi:MAG: hypothetical protein IJX92_04485 [Clostridia bacterium]|nr:hypothetical protein [Clostridia bacterium]
MKLISKRADGSILLTELFSALSDFAQENFRGLIDIHSDCDEGEQVRVSAEHIIYFLKLMLKCTGGERFFEIYAKSENGVLTVIHSADSPFSISRTEQANLTSYALKAGFRIKFTGMSILLYAELEHGAKVASIYSYTAKSLSKIFEQAFTKNLSLSQKAR